MGNLRVLIYLGENWSRWLHDDGLDIIVLLFLHESSKLMESLFLGNFVKVSTHFSMLSSFLTDGGCRKNCHCAGKCLILIEFWDYVEVLYVRTNFSEYLRLGERFILC